MPRRLPAAPWPFGTRHIVLVFCTAIDEAAIEIRDQVGGAPVQLCGDGGHEGGHESGDHDPAQRRRHMLTHNHHVARFGMLQVGIENDRRQRGQNPGPGAQGVVRDVEPEDGEQAIAVHPWR